MTKDLNRSAYTRRIMEIVSNIKRQKEDIDKILVDTRKVQREINQVRKWVGPGEGAEPVKRGRSQ